MTKGVIAVALGLAAIIYGVAASVHAATWQVVQNSDCSGYQTASALSATAVVPCCTGKSTGSCDRREYVGTLILRFPNLVTGATQTYTAGGDTLNATATARLGMGTVLWDTCEEITNSGLATSGGQSVVLAYPVNARCTGAGAPYACCSGAGAGSCGNTSPLVVQIYNTGVTTPTILNGGEFPVTASALSNAAVSCMIFGYGG